MESIILPHSLFLSLYFLPQVSNTLKPLKSIAFMLYTTFMFIGSNSVVADSSLNGWWQAFRPAEETIANKKPKTILFRRDGKLYLVERDSCNVKAEYREEYVYGDNVNTYITTDRGHKTYYAYRIEQDKMFVALLIKDNRIGIEPPPNMKSSEEVRLFVSKRMPVSPCDEPDSNYPNVPVVQAPYSYDKTKFPLWAVDCHNPKLSGWFLMDERPESGSPIVIGNSIKSIPYRGLHDIENVFKDERIKWVSHDEILVANTDKEWGWSGTRTYHRCNKSTLEQLQ